MKASSEPRELVVSTGPQDRLVISNVVVGDVWICSGQSNMEWSQGRSMNSKPLFEQASQL